VDGIKEDPTERERSEQSKEARRRVQPVFACFGGK
jgi:hypothetical protein